MAVRQRERLDQHAHAAGRSPAGDGEGDAGLIQLPHSRLRRLGQHLVLGDQRTIHVGQKQTNVMLRRHCFCSEAGITGRQARSPSRASSSSAAFGPSLPES